MLLCFKTELKLNNKQKTLLAKSAGAARHAYNKGLAACIAVLEHNKQYPQNKLKFPSSVDLHKWLVEAVKPNNLWYYEVSKCSPQQALRDLSQAFKDFFKGKTIADKKVGFPRFKKKGRRDSFYLDGCISCDHFKIQLPRIGWVVRPNLGQREEAKPSEVRSF